MRARARDIVKRKHGAPVHPMHPKSHKIGPLFDKIKALFEKI